jgi:hypothetical protein
MVYNVGLAISTCIGIIVEMRFFPQGVCLLPILWVKTVCNQGILVHTASWETSILERSTFISVGNLVPSQLVYWFCV